MFVSNVNPRQNIIIDKKRQNIYTIHISVSRKRVSLLSFHENAFRVYPNQQRVSYSKTVVISRHVRKSSRLYQRRMWKNELSRTLILPHAGASRSERRIERLRRESLQRCRRKSGSRRESATETLALLVTSSLQIPSIVVV